MYPKRLFLEFIFFIQSLQAFQKDVNVFKEKDYKFLANEFYKNEKDSIIAMKYANAYLVKAKRDLDTLRIADGYYLLSRVSSVSVSQKYSDSIIALTVDKNFNDYPIYAYLNKAVIYYNDGDFKHAFDYYLKVNQAAKSNKFLFYKSKMRIGTLKIRLGEYQNALDDLKECYDYYVLQKENNFKDYLKTLFHLSEAYRRIHKLDSTTILNRLGYQEAIRLKGENHIPFFILSEGINQYDKKNYIIARDSLVKSIKLLKTEEDQANLAIGYFYLGKVLFSLGDIDEAITAFKNVDIIFHEISEIMPETRESYEYIINYYKEKQDRDNQLKYIERLLQADNLLHSNYKYLLKKIVKKYDTSQLLGKKQEIIDGLEQEKFFSKIMNIFLISISIILFVFLMYTYQKKKRYKIKFNELLEASNVINEVEPITIEKEEIESIGIPEDVIQEVLNKLENFEHNADFLQQDITLVNLAKKIDTNSRYLSKVVNKYKQKTFKTYINDLRIDHSIEKLKTDKKYRNYTIKAIAFDMGFKTIVAFSRSFYKKTGIHPSYFIKELEKQV